MNILIFNWRDIRHPRAGGAEVRLHRVYEPIAHGGNQVTLVCSGFEGGAAQESLNGITIRRFGSEISFMFWAIRNMKKLIAEYQPDILVEDFNKLPLFSPWRVKMPILIQMHHLWRGSIFREASFISALVVWIGEQTLSMVYRKERFCVVSDSTCRELEQYHIPQKNIAVIHNGVDLDWFTPASSENLGAEKYLLLVGRIQKYKGVIDACAAFAQIADQYPHLILKIAGNGLYRPNLEKWIREHRLESRIHLLGFVSEEEKRTLLRRAYFLIQPSYKEGWGLTVIEANACGVPVVANNAPGLLDSVCHQKTGLLYRFGSIDDAAHCMKEMLEFPELRDSLAAQCRLWAERFTWNCASEETYTLIQEIVESSRNVSLTKLKKKDRL